MSANKSQRQMRAIVMARPVIQHADHELILVCEPCGRRDRLPLATYTSGTVGEVLGRLRCRRCKAEPSVATLTDRDGRKPVRLLGPGAFG